MRYIVITLLLLLAGCKAKEKTIDRSFSDSDSVLVVNRIDTIWSTTIVRDTVFLKVKDPESNNIVITDPCDSVTNKLREFEMRAGNTVVSSRGGNLSIKTECDSVIEQYTSVEKEKKSLVKQVSELSERVSNYESKEKVVEKTGIVGWFEKWRIGIGWFVAGVVSSTVFWFIMRVIGKV